MSELNQTEQLLRTLDKIQGFCQSYHQFNLNYPLNYEVQKVWSQFQSDFFAEEISEAIEVLEQSCRKTESLRPTKALDLLTNLATVLLVQSNVLLTNFKGNLKRQETLKQDVDKYLDDRNHITNNCRKLVRLVDSKDNKIEQLESQIDDLYIKLDKLQDKYKKSEKAANYYKDKVDLTTTELDSLRHLCNQKDEALLKLTELPYSSATKSDMSPLRTKGLRLTQDTFHTSSPITSNRSSWQQGYENDIDVDTTIRPITSTNPADYRYAQSVESLAPPLIKDSSNRNSVNSASYQVRLAKDITEGLPLTPQTQQEAEEDLDLPGQLTNVIADLTRSLRNSQNEHTYRKHRSLALINYQPKSQDVTDSLGRRLSTGNFQNNEQLNSFTDFVKENNKAEARISADLNKVNRQLAEMEDKTTKNRKQTQQRLVGRNASTTRPRSNTVTPIRNLSGREVSTMPVRNNKLKPVQVSHSIANSSTLNDSEDQFDHTAVALAIHAVAVGELVLKSSRSLLGSEKRHLRYLWVDPQNKAVAWSKKHLSQATFTKDNWFRTKSIPIRSIRVISDPIQYSQLENGVEVELAKIPELSIVIDTTMNSRSIKFKLMDLTRHEIWTTALTNLHLGKRNLAAGLSIYQNNVINTNKTNIKDDDTESQTNRFKSLKRRSFLSTKPKW